VESCRGIGPPLSCCLISGAEWKITRSIWDYPVCLNDFVREKNEEFSDGMSDRAGIAEWRGLRSMSISFYNSLTFSRSVSLSYNDVAYGFG
jgi:hypothetical protein